MNPFLEDGGSRIVPVLHLIDEAIPIGDYECDLTDAARSGLRTVLHSIIAAVEVLNARETAFREVWAEMIGQRGILLLLDQEETDD